MSGDNVIIEDWERLRFALKCLLEIVDPLLHAKSAIDSQPSE